MQFQFEDCPMADILSSSSLSSSDSETDKTCDSDREGDDELTDWPGNEGVATLPGGRSKSQKMMGKGGLPLIKSDDTQDEDTRMSAEDMGVSTSMRMQPVVLPLRSSLLSAGWFSVQHIQVLHRLLQLLRFQVLISYFYLT